jgi:hypothetical protein
MSVTRTRIVRGRFRNCSAASDVNSTRIGKFYGELTDTSICSLWGVISLAISIAAERTQTA